MLHNVINKRITNVIYNGVVYPILNGQVDLPDRVDNNPDYKPIEIKPKKKKATKKED